VHLKFIAARAAAVAVLSCASVSMPALVVFADANPDNRGHHYGQLKHQHPPVPAPQPPPATAPPPAAVVPALVRPNPPAVLQPDVAIAQTNPPAVSIGVIPPLPDLGGQTAPQKTAGAVQPFRDPNLWVVEALLPALLILWLMLLAASRVLRKRTPAAKA
jgi:hypothetical protein